GLDLRTLLHPPVTADSRPRGGMDLRRMLGRGGEGTGATPGPLDRTLYAQPATFTVEYALACLWESWGVRPDALIGYSLGEYVAACLAGVFGFEEAVALVAQRARLVDALPAGAMLAVPLPEQRVRELLAEGEGLYLAAVNGPGLCVVSGTDEAVAGLAARLSAQGVAVRPLRTTHAFHSALMEPVAERFGAAVAAARPQPPRLPYVSNVTGDWVTTDQARDPAFWVRHLLEPVRFGDGAARLWDDPDRLVLEVGPGQTLGSLALGVRPRGAEGPGACASLPGGYDAQSEEHFILRGLGRLWAAGVAPQWPATATAGVPARLSLPGYPFQGRRHWLEGEPAPAPVPAPVPSPAGAVPSLARKADLADWFHVPVWEPIAPHPVSLPPSAETATSWLLLLDDEGVGSALGASLADAGHRVVTVRAADSYGHGPDGFRIDPAAPDHYHRLVEDLLAAGGMPRRVVHLWSVGPSDGIERGLERGVLSVLRLNRAAAGRCGPLDLTLVSSDAHAVLGTEVVAPEKATLSGPALVLPLEQEGTTCRVVDMSMASARDGHGRHVAHLLAELLEPAPHPLVCLRGSRRWSRGHRPVRLAGDGGRTAIRERGTYLITGGFGGIGRSVARHLATAAKARLVLVGRVPLPPLEEWDALRATAAQDDPVADRVRFVQELEERGAEVLAVDADVTDPGRMDEVATLAVARFGAVHGIIHAAGVPAAGPAQLKRDADVLRVLAPKVRGATVVDGLARRLRPDFIVLCSSTLALTGGIGQVDYVAANAFLDALAHRNDVLGGPRTLAVDWDGWQEVGMAARLLGPAGGPRQRHSVGPVDHPLLRECLADDGDTAVYRVPLSVESSWLVDEHRMAGSAVVPGTGHLELVRAAHEHQTGAATAELRDVTFLAPVVVGENRQTELRVVLDKTRTPYRFTVVARQEGRHEDAADSWRVHATGAVGPLPETAVRRHDVARLVAEGELKDLGAVEHRGPMGFGPRSRCLRRVHLGPGGALAELELPDEFTGDLDRIHLHPSLLDLAAGFHGMNLAEEFRIPLSYGRLLLHAPLPRRFFSHHRFHDADRPGKQTHTADITLFDDTGREVARVERFVLKRVPGLDERIASLRDGTSADVVPYRLPAVGTRTLREGTLSDHLAQGILPDEGVEALVRLLASGIGPQVAVVAKDLDAVYADIRRFAGPRHPSGPAGAVEPPSAGTGAQAPEPTEENLARLWSELLGVPRVGPHDNFFELGGHSLLGLQMVARIRDRFGVDLPLSTPFEALTVAELSPVLRAARDGRPAPAHA
ncbi:SDR family NAD(P)-dependent oxidoreductase, partial [Streptomyces flaveolus]|uniref:polyketide synthase family protein n=1 Tax=Streptomyces flaveolus TaxID=67297 RepID=UPI00343BC22D